MTSTSGNQSVRLQALWQRRYWLAVIAAAVLLAYSLLAPSLPRLSHAPGLTVTLVVNCLLLALLLYGLSPLLDLGPWALAVGGAAFVLAVVFGLAGWTAAASLCKVVAAASIGYLLAGYITSTMLVVGIAVLGAVIDIVSVAVGPTHVLLQHSPQAVGALTVAMVWPGISLGVGYTALGVSDLVFMSLYIGAAAKFRLREEGTALACAAAVALTVVFADYFTALPVLPLLGLAFVGVNADLLFRRKRTPPAEKEAAG